MDSYVSFANVTPNSSMPCVFCAESMLCKDISGHLNDKPMQRFLNRCEADGCKMFVLQLAGQRQAAQGEASQVDDVLRRSAIEKKKDE